MIAIVALPAYYSQVRNLSSEKVPHLTLLVLGDGFENQKRVTEFVAHASSTLKKFYLPVERRGVLGDKSADVLFFDKDSAKPMADFRAQLLGNPDIFKAYSAIEQFPSWTPHLTLGYPESPAKPENREYPEPGILSVPFDKIALWTGDYEGVEFELEDNGLSMSDRGAEFLEHFGVKGMKWGVVRAQAPGVAKAAVKKAYAPSKDARSAQLHMARAKLGGVRALDNKEMQLVIQRMELEQRYKDLYGERQYHDEAVSKAKRYGKKGARWAGRLFTDILRDGASSWIKRPGSNASGATSAKIRATVGSPMSIAGASAPRAIGS